MNVDGDYIKIFPKRKAAYDSYGKTLIVLYSMSVICNKYLSCL